MKRARPYPGLATLMGGYLHQDFDLCYEDDDAAIRDYAQTQTVERVWLTVAEVDRLLAGPSMGLLARFHADVSRWDYNIGDTDDEARAWLLKARGLLADAVADR